jgi:hypothetical protein
MSTSWTPLRKILAAAITAVVAAGGLIAFVTTGHGDWRAILGVALAAALPVIVGYLVPSAPGEAAPQPAPALKAGESPY